MTRQPPSPEIIRTERAFQIYVSTIHSSLALPYQIVEIDKDVLSQLKALSELSYKAAEIFIDFSVNQDDANTEALMEFVDPTYQEPFEPIE